MKKIYFIPRKIIVYLISIYKFFLSPIFYIILGGSCRYQPTCSEYAIDCVEKFGIYKGIRLSLRRFLRCHPFSKEFGYDPVPSELS